MRSLIEFNTDIPKSALGLVPIFAHEGYPGHHTEAILKEQKLWRECGYGLASPERAQKSLGFMTHPLFRSYVFTYFEGYELISKAAGVADKTDVFLSCLNEQKLPSQLAAQGARLARGG